jgi:hypothetical protein
MVLCGDWWYCVVTDGTVWWLLVLRGDLMLALQVLQRLCKEDRNNYAKWHPWR